MSDTGKSAAAEMMSGISVKPTAAELREAKKREAEVERALLALGTVWQLNDAREEPLFVKVVTMSNFWIGIRHLNGNSGNRLFYPQRHRFGGTKRGNYAFVRAS